MKRGDIERKKTPPFCNVFRIACIYTTQYTSSPLLSTPVRVYSARRTYTLSLNNITQIGFNGLHFSRKKWTITKKNSATTTTITNCRSKWLFPETEFSFRCSFPGTHCAHHIFAAVSVIFNCAKVRPQWDQWNESRIVHDARTNAFRWRNERWKNNANILSNCVRSRKKKQQRTPQQCEIGRKKANCTNGWVNEKDRCTIAHTQQIEWERSTVWARSYTVIRLPICNTPFKLAFGNRVVVVVRACLRTFLRRRTKHNNKKWFETKWKR